MSTMLLPELAASFVRPLAATDSELPRMSVGGLRSLVSTLTILDDGIHKLWGEVETSLATEGMDGQVLRDTAKGFADGLEVELRFLANVMARAAHLGKSAEAHRLAVAAIDNSVRALLAEVSAVFQQANRAADPAYRAALLEGAEKNIAASSGACTSHEELVAGFKDE